MKILSASFATALTLLLAGCGGGGSSSVIPSGNPNVNPTTTPAATATPGGTATPTPAPNASTSPSAVNTASITFLAPPRSAANGASLAPISTIVAAIKSINGNATLPGSVNPTTVVSVTANNCSDTANGLQCTFTLPAPAGNVATVITAYAGSAPVATGSFTFVSTGAAGQSQSYTLGAVVKNVAFTFPALTLNQPSTKPISIVTTDQSDAIIGGSAPFSGSISLSITSGADVAQLQVGGDASTLGSTVPFNNPSSLINLVYTGGSYGSINIDSNGTNSEIATQSGVRQTASLRK